MDCILYVSKTELTRSDLVRFVEVHGGRWSPEPTLDNGVVSDIDATVYVSGPLTPSSEYSEEELSEQARLMKTHPASVVALDIGRARNSLALACRLARDLMSRWGGMIDGNNVIESVIASIE